MCEKSRAGKANSARQRLSAHLPADHRLVASSNDRIDRFVFLLEERRRKKIGRRRRPAGRQRGVPNWPFPLDFSRTSEGTALIRSKPIRLNRSAAKPCDAASAKRERFNQRGPKDRAEPNNKIKPEHTEGVRGSERPKVASVAISLTSRRRRRVDDHHQPEACQRAKRATKAGRGIHPGLRQQARSTISRLRQLMPPSRPATQAWIQSTTSTPKGCESRRPRRSRARRHQSNKGEGSRRRREARLKAERPRAVTST